MSFRTTSLLIILIVQVTSKKKKKTKTLSEREYNIKGIRPRIV